MSSTGRISGAILICAATLISAHAWACSSCGCTLSSDWGSQGLATGAGFRFDLRADYFNQDQLRSGTGTVDTGAIVFPTEREIQEKTINRNFTLTLDYSPTVDWGVAVQIPYFNRYHTTIAEGDTAISTSHTESLGDVRVLGRYQGLADDHSSGVQFGLKLATGSFNETFIDGPQAGEPLDRGLQPGTGTTDVLIGIYHFGALSRDWDYFAQALVQQPLGPRDDFRPGTGLNVTAGTRYVTNEMWVPHVQLNMRAEKPESGANADVENSGATLIYLSPGITYNAGKNFKPYAFMQVPVYQRVNGYQLEPRYSFSVGVHYSM
ncbi:MAG TPA: hypothetical protein VEI74_06390 [Candidatus Methylomirabilis sp.]|nr:hypothetical protein [Candidatus Methylomirabilis sp.]